MGFHCQKCRFKSEREKIPLKCPYCGTSGTVTKNETATDILLKSS